LTTSSPRTGASIALATAICVVMAISACSAAGAPRTARSTSVTNEPASGPTAIASTPRPAFTPDPYWVTLDGQVYPQGQPSGDSGPMKFATGTATLDASGQPVAYAAAPGDVFSVLALRFRVQPDMLEGMNCLRRDPQSETLYVGDIVNLDPHTAISVGTQNGRVFTPTTEQRARCLEYLPPQH
jgi:hypothetical protein